jgi:hypothetical protein
MRPNSYVEYGQEIVAPVYAHAKELSLSLGQKECDMTAPELWLAHKYDKQSKLRFAKDMHELICHLLFSAVSGPVYNFLSTL